MFQTNLDKRSLRSALLLGAASAAVASLSVPAAAQETTETVVVTGSRIPQTGLYSSSPVTAVGQQEMKFEGTTNVENLLNNLPSAFADFGSNESNGSVGTATVNLRNLTCPRTLVLVDGKRLMPGDNELPCADLNQIPAALIDHVEVVTGGASAVYGSDAVAGVVNFIMRRDFEGIEFDGQYSGNWHDNTNSVARGIVANGLGGTNPGTIPQAPNSVFDGEDVDGTIIMGANSPNGKGNVTAYAGFRNIQPVTEDARDFSACATSTTFSGSFRCGGSSTAARDGAGGRFISLNGGPCGDCTIDGTTGETRASRAPTNSTSRRTTTCSVPTRVTPSARWATTRWIRPSTSTDRPCSWTITRLRRSPRPVSSSAHWLRSTAITRSLGLSPTTLLRNMASAALAATSVRRTAPACSSAAATWKVGRVRITSNMRHTASCLAPRATLALAGRTDLSGQYGSTILSEEYTNDMSINRIQHALQVVTDPATGNPTCKSGSTAQTRSAFREHFQPGGVTPAAINYLDVPGFREGGTQEWVVSGNVTGDLGAWGVQSPWAKTLSPSRLAVNIAKSAWKIGSTSNSRPAISPARVVPRKASMAASTWKRGFGDIRVPIVQNMPFVEDLTANAGYRYSSYSIAGAVHSYKYGLEWQPVEDFRLRGSFQRAGPCAERA